MSLILQIKVISKEVIPPSSYPYLQVQTFHNSILQFQSSVTTDEAKINIFIEDIAGILKRKSQVGYLIQRGRQSQSQCETENEMTRKIYEEKLHIKIKNRSYILKIMEKNVFQEVHNKCRN